MDLSKLNVTCILQMLRSNEAGKANLAKWEEGGDGVMYVERKSQHFKHMAYS